MTYKERVQAIAEKMALDFDARHGKIYGPASVKEYAKQHIPAARIAVAEMSDLAESFYHAEAMRDGWGLDQVNEVVDRKLKEQGLIPDGAQEASSNE